MGILAGYIDTSYELDLPGEAVFNLKSFIFLIIDPEYGAMVFDAGSPQKREETIERIKTCFNIEIEDIKWIFNTHLHIDHIGLNILAADTGTKIIISKEELESINKIINAAYSDSDFYEFMIDYLPGFKGNFSRNDANIWKRDIRKFWPEAKKINNKKNVYYIEDSPELPGNVTILPTPGHTFNHYGYKISFPNIDIFILGDALSNRYEFMYSDEDPYEPQADIPLYNKTRKNLLTKKGLMVPAHDRPFYSTSLKSLKKNVFYIEDLVLPSN